MKNKSQPPEKAVDNLKHPSAIKPKPKGKNPMLEEAEQDAADPTHEKEVPSR